MLSQPAFTCSNFEHAIAGWYVAYHLLPLFAFMVRFSSHKLMQCNLRLFFFKFMKLMSLHEQKQKLLCHHHIS